MPYRLGRSLPLAGLLFALTSCAPGATEILVVVDTDLRIPGEIDLITARITDPTGDVRTSDARFGVDEPPLPRTLGLVHEGGALGPFDVVVSGTLGGTEVVRREARVSFVAGEIRVLRMFLIRDCVGRMCDAGTTCDESGCRPVLVSADELPLWTGEVPRLPDGDAGPPGDGGMDAGDDGGLDAGLDAALEAGTDAGDCPAVCTGGCGIPGRCTVTGTAATGVVRCPPGLNCRVECSGAGACPADIHCPTDGGSCSIICDGTGSCAGAINCESASSCSVSCGGSMSCASAIDCSSAAMCTIGCTNAGSCAGDIACRASGACDVTCSGSGSCAGTSSCETAECGFDCSGMNSCAAGVSCASSCRCAATCGGSGSCSTPSVCPTGCDASPGCRFTGVTCSTCT